MSEEFEREVLPRVPLDRRAFLKRMAVTAAFAAPVVASFNMIGLDAGVAHGFTSNTGRQASICRAKIEERNALQSADASLPPDAPPSAHNRLQRRIDRLTTYINTNCGG
jgi:hypothetical protein